MLKISLDHFVNDIVNHVFIGVRNMIGKVESSRLVTTACKALPFPQAKKSAFSFTKSVPLRGLDQNS